MPDDDHDRAQDSQPSTPVRRQIIMEPETSAHFLKDKQTIPGLRLDYNRFDQEWEETMGTYVPRGSKQSEAKETENEYQGPVVDDVNKYAFSIVRYYRPSDVASEHSVDTSIHIWSPYWITAAQKVMKSVINVSWTLRPITFPPQLLLSFLNYFEEYLAELEANPSEPDAELIIEHVEFFIRFMRLEHHDTLRQLQSYLADGMIPWDMLWGLYTPGMIVRHYDTIVHKQHFAKLVAISKAKDDSNNEEYWRLDYEYLERGTDGEVGWIDDWIRVNRYPAAEKIENLVAVPFDRLPNKEELKEQLIARGKKWYELSGTHHMMYDGLGYRMDFSNPSKTEYKKSTVKSRIMIDRSSFVVHCSSISTARRTLEGESMTLTVQSEDPKPERSIPPDDILMLAPAYLFGMVLATKEWLLFDAECVSEIKWNQEAFKNLSLPADQKQLIRSLVESHQQTKGTVDDFVEGKGRGLIISLFGPPGVGKTLTAEATSELTHRPLYVVGAGEIGKSAIDLENNLRNIFSITSLWSAVVLIDEADVFLEKRSTANLDRNAIVAVLLRQLEYFPGILFLTTNRQIVFDEALQSRIHVSLHYPDLVPFAKEQIWLAFLKRAKVDTDAWIANGTIRRLRNLSINGRQIKNTVNTASVLARHKKEELEERHIWQVIKTNEEYGADASKRSAERIARKRRNLRVASFLLTGALIAVMGVRFLMTPR